MEIYDIDTKVSFVCKHPPEEKPEGSTTPQGVCMSVKHTPCGIVEPLQGRRPISALYGSGCLQTKLMNVL